MSRYRGVLTRESVHSAKLLLEKHPGLSEILGKDWLKSTLVSGRRMDKTPPLFWYLANPSLNQRFAESLIYLSEQSSNPKFVSELKIQMDASTLNGRLRELETYFHLSRDKKLDVVWQPTVTVGSHTYSPDLLINTDPLIYLEIVTLNDPELNVRQGKVINLLQEKINRLRKNPFSIILHFKTAFDWELVKPVVSFIRKKVLELAASSVDKHQIAFEWNGKTLITANLYRVEGKGGLGGYIGPGGSISPGGRLKGTILEKIKKQQLPPKGNHMNGLVIFLDSFAANFFDLDSAILGQHAITFSTLRSNAKPRYIHQPNGVISHELWQKSGVNLVDFFLATKLKDYGYFRKDSSRILFDDRIKGRRKFLQSRLLK